MCYHQFLEQVETHEKRGKLIEPRPCPYCDPKGYARWKEQIEQPRKSKR